MEDAEIKRHPHKFLQKCIEENKPALWNSWRKDNLSFPTVFNQIKLEDKNFSNFNCKKVHFNKCELIKCNFDTVEGIEIQFLNTTISECSFVNARMMKGQFANCNISNSIFHLSFLDGSKFMHSVIISNNFNLSYLNNTNFNDAEINKCEFQKCKMHGAEFTYAKSILNSSFEKAKMTEIVNGGISGTLNCEAASFRDTYLESCNFKESRLAGVEFNNSDIVKCNFKCALVNGETSFWDTQIDDQTDFTGVGLSGTRIEHGIYDWIKYIERKRQWCEWYKKGNLIQKMGRSLIIRPFWFITNYGHSTTRIIWSFLFMSIAFSVIYFFSALIFPPGVIDGLLETSDGTIKCNNWFDIFVRSFYFSIVTMTTLGFGDMYAVHGNIISHLLLIIQVLIGYVLLGALITRLGMLFTSKGPN